MIMQLVAVKIDRSDDGKLTVMILAPYTNARLFFAWHSKKEFVAD